MDKNAIKKYAVWARRELIARVSQKAAQLEIEDGKTLDRNAETVNGVVLTPTDKAQRTALVDRINNKGYEQVMEEVAYTWFNRFCALRFMEVNNYLPTHIRVFTNEENEFKPQIIDEAIHLELDGLDMQKVYDFKENNDNEGLYKYLIITQCNALGKILPGMFERISDYTELLFPDNILREGSVIDRLITDITEDNFSVDSENGQVEIIGWLYQYYISEKHEKVISVVGKKVISKQDIPAATQLFTTDWVVRYLIDNSVGRYWIERNPNSELAEKLEYFVAPKNNEIEYIDEKITPEELTVLDPCMGSGHFLVYAFDVLMYIYDECGYSQRDAVRSIIENNIVGFDIDDRASQLSYFSVIMTACKYDSRFLRRKDSDGNPDIPQPQVYAIQESNKLYDYAIDEFTGDNAELKENLGKILMGLDNAKEIGSLCLFDKNINFELLYNRFDEINNEITMNTSYIMDVLLPVVKTAELLIRKYAVVATNPPYLNKYSNDLKKFVNDNFKDYSGDLFSVFMYHNFSFCKQNGYSAFMTPNVWMFIKSYEKLRKFILEQKTIISLIQMAKGAFFKEATVDICSFVFANTSTDSRGLYFRLEDYRGDMEVQKEKVLEAIANKECGYLYEADETLFSKIPGSPVAYWISKNFIRAFEKGVLLGSIADSKQGLATADNNRFLREWFEISYDKIKFDCKTIDESKDSGYKWFPYNKGGEFRKWYGNNDYVVNWLNDGFEIKHFFDEKGKLRSRPQNLNYMFRSSVSWSDITSGINAFRYKPSGHLFDISGMSFFAEDRMKYLLALCNTKIIVEMLKIIAPTLHCQCGDVANIPVIYDENKNNCIDVIVEDNINISKTDWDAFETSWDFKKHPLIKKANILWDATAVGAAMSHYYGGHPEVSCPMELCYMLWQGECNERFSQLKTNEEELNRIFIDIYGLQDELTPDVADKDITVHRIYDTKDDVPESMKGSNYVRTKRDEIVSLISYAVGCMFGRYSLYQNGIYYAGGIWEEKYEYAITHADCNAEDIDDFPTTRYLPDEDNIIPICDDEYFEDDIVGKFIEFIETVFDKDKLEENLQFIADALGGNGKNARLVIRNYFLNDFYADHCKIYQKRPIYWLFDSGKKNGFKALVYMHRYREDTIARMRTDYVHEQQSRYRTAIEDMENKLLNAEGSERVKFSKALGKLKEQDEEIRIYEEKIHHLADQMIRIDLDDGVKKNYEIFKDVLAKIK